MRRARYVYCPFAYNQNHLSTGGFTIRPYFCFQEASCRRLSVPLQSNRPHVWGENCQIAMPVFTPNGSPPRGWGKPHRAARAGRSIRFTPTRVGKTCELPLPTLYRTVHPHAGGENQASPNVQALPNGSPPRGWGKPSTWVQKGIRGRFTPTRVGKTRWAGWTASHFTVHPHACGENVKADPERIEGFGSPPRVWGKHLSLVANDSRNGSPPRVWGKLTPALS